MAKQSKDQICYFEVPQTWAMAYIVVTQAPHVFGSSWKPSFQRQTRGWMTASISRQPSFEAIEADLPVSCSLVFWSHRLRKAGHDDPSFALWCVLFFSFLGLSMLVPWHFETDGLQKLPVARQQLVVVLTAGSSTFPSGLVAMMELWGSGKRSRVP